MEMENRNILKKYKYLRKLNLEGYLWEFIRRNEDYKKLYNEFIKYKEHFRKRNWHELPKYKIFYELKMKLKGYGLNYPLDPSIQANKIIDLKSYFMINQTVEILCMDDHPDRALCWQYIEATGHKVALLINLESSERKIISNIKKIFKRAKKAFKVSINNHKVSKIEKEKRKRKDWYEYLIAYDLIKINKITIKEIAEILPYTRHKKSDLQNHTSGCNECRKVRRYINKAEQLINSKYRDYIPSPKTSK